ncbi:DUF4133 domain-containing protein [Mucilaginibacter terrigena]|uniref:DUF4133 domain-containing protein n=1 Tax=Mucilaginibacter terrigena TaxID=2492395 RepID=A0A4Q5LNM8_9SPHI|nr:DUF4133 domain-containing protein [Mucilaginibacter terrigena]RYU90939.1 DUF4133 domain-containing protein [Mucilaginibacter terrigena]
MALYQINKGINKPIEFKGLKAQYIGYLAGGLVLLLIGFAVMYIVGVPVMICILLISILGSALFYQVFKMSHKYGEHGLMKKAAKRYLPDYLKFTTRKIFLKLKK